jgi:serine/threonine-protein kinase
VATDVIGDYRLKESMGVGQFSQVWEVVETVSGRHFAMKMLLPEHVNKSQQRGELLHEAAVGLKLAHPNVIKIVKVDKNSRNPYFVMEFFPGGSLKSRIQHYQEHFPFLKEQSLFIFHQAAKALAYMNTSGWVHRDVKPENFLVNSVGELRLIDFAIAQRIPKGLARLFHRKGQRQGTRSYMSPEQIECKPLDARADIYSFGATAYEVITGRPPFRGLSAEDLLTKHLHDKPVPPQSFNKDITEEFGNLVLRMLAKKRDDRPRNFHEVLMEMQKLRVWRSLPPRKGDKRL